MTTIRPILEWLAQLFDSVPPELREFVELVFGTLSAAGTAPLSVGIDLQADPARRPAMQRSRSGWHGALWETELVKEPSGAIGRRVLVIGMAGSGKSTFSRALSAKTGLPVIHLDFHYWKPGWVKPSDDEWRDKQRGLLAGDAWIVDGNTQRGLDLRLERAETVVLLDTPWWTCAGRAFMRGLRNPVGEMPEGCRDSVRRRLLDEWRLVGVILRDRHSELERARVIVSQHGQHVALHVLGSKRAAREFLSGLHCEPGMRS